MMFNVLPEDEPRCSVPCADRKSDCLRARAEGSRIVHYPGGANCHGFLPFQACDNCAMWNRAAGPSGRMPGITDRHRPCTRPGRMDKSRTEYRNPKDWCDSWKERGDA